MSKSGSPKLPASSAPRIQLERPPASAPLVSPTAPRAFGLIAVALAVAMFFVMLSESLVKSPMSDEPPHIASGLSYVATGIFRGNLQHPPLLKELSGLTLLMGGIRWPRTPQTESFLRGNLPKGAEPEWRIGNEIIISNGIDRTLLWARLPFILISSLLAILIYYWGRQLVGALAAICATFLYVTDPTIIGLGFTVTMDAGLTAFLVLFLFVLWRYLRNPTPRRLIFCGLALGLTLCAKFSALVLLPVAGLLLCAAVVWPAAEPGRKRAILDPYYVQPGETPLLWRFQPKAGRNDPCPCGSGKKYKTCHGNQASAFPAAWLYRRFALCAGVFLVMCLIAVVVIEALYFFQKDPLLYVKGAQLVNADHRPDFLAYFAGTLQRRFTGYFAYAYLLKEPLAAIILACIGLVLLFRGKSVTPLQRLFLLVPPALFFIGTSMLADQVGIRYIMPVLPFAHLLGGLALAMLFTMTAKWGRCVAVALCAWLALAVAGIYPDHLSYFNESACLLGDPSRIGLDGGSKCGILWLDDSNIDYRQGFKQLKLWLDRHETGRIVRLSGPDGPEYFPADAYGIRNVKPDVMELGRQPISGLYAVSASSVARVAAVPGASDWLRRTPPVAVVGHALYVYDVP